MKKRLAYLKLKKLVKEQLGDQRERGLRKKKKKCKNQKLAQMTAIAPPLDSDVGVFQMKQTTYQCASYRGGVRSGNRETGVGDRCHWASITV